jgi:hypothetical protein
VHVDVEGGGVLDEVLAVTAVDPDLADRVAGGGDLVERNLSSWRGYNVRIVDDTGEELGTYTSRVSASTTRVGAVAVAEGLRPFGRGAAGVAERGEGLEAEGF